VTTEKTGVERIDSEMTATCHACRSQIATAVDTCPHCGTRVTPTVVGVDQAQRRWITVTFTDVVGSTEISRRMDPEDYGDMLLRYQELCDEVAQHRSGHVSSFAGDGLLAVYGWPTSLERDADVAVEAAFDFLEALPDLNNYLTEKYGIRISVRIAVHSGLAVVGKLGNVGRVDTSVFGDIGNVAERLQKEAPTNAVVVSDVTARILRDRWVLESRGHPELTGVGSDFEVFLVVGHDPVSGPDVQRLYELVDRDEPLQKLRQVWSEVSEGQGQVVLVQGEAGVGKSRLAYELQHDHATRASWLTVQCSPLASEEPFGPLAAHLPAADVPTGRSPEERRAAGLSAALRWTIGLAESGPAVLHVEDVHWADPSTGELIERVSFALANESRPLLVLCTARPGADQRWLDRTPARRIALPPLKDDDMSALVSSATDGRLPEGVVAEIVNRSDGLPLYAEEVAATIVDQPREVPSTLQGMLTASLDQLDSELFVLVQKASAMGRVVDDAVLGQLVDPDVDLESQLGRLVESKVLVPLPEARHKFRHALLQEAAYESMLQRQRRSVHARIGAILRDRHGALVEAQPWLLAHHLEEARDPEAMSWFERAGAKAAADAAFWEATSHFQRALDVGEMLGGLAASDELRLQIRLGNAMFGAQGWGAPETLPVWTHAEKLARDLSAVDELTSVLNGIATYWTQVGDCRRSATIANEILHAAEDLRTGQLRGHCTLALNHLFLGETAPAFEHAHRAIALYRTEDFHTVTYGFGTDQGVIAYCVAGAAAWFSGRHDEGIALTGAAVQLGRTLSSPISELLARVFKGLVHYLRGESELTRSEAEVLSVEGSRLSLQLGVGFGHILGGAVRAIEQADASGVADIESGMNELVESGGQAGAPIVFVLLAHANLSMGSPGAAREAAQAGQAIADALDQHFVDTELIRLEVVAARELGMSVHDAVAVLRTAVDAAMTQGQTSLALRAACDLATLTPEATQTVSTLLEKIEGGYGTRDRRRAQAVLAATAMTKPSDQRPPVNLEEIAP
jgi:class 3 adenylate cyclase